MRDLGPQIAEYLDALSEPISAAEVKRTTVAPIAPDHTRPRWVVPAVAAVVLAVLAGGLVAIATSPDGPAELHSGPSTSAPPTSVMPPATVLAPVGSDPVVGCDPGEGSLFPVSAWSNPLGAENDSDPAAGALRDNIEERQLIIQMAQENGTTAPFLPGPSTFRRLYETEDMVVFGAGTLTPETLSDADSDEPLITVVATNDAGTWRVTEGPQRLTCDYLVVDPGEGLSPAEWWITAEGSISPDTTELELSVSGFPDFCMSSLRAGEVVGPDVVETEESVTIRVAVDREPTECEGIELSEPVEVEVRLQEPLGDRVILDGNRFPAQLIEE